MTSTRARAGTVTAMMALVLVTGCSSDDPAAVTANPPAASEGTGTQTTPPSTPPSVTPGTAAPAPATPSLGTPPAGLTTLSDLTGQSTTLTIQQTPLRALSALGIEFEPVGGARTEPGTGGDTAFVFPVTGGQVTVAPSGAQRLSGTVQHQGGLRLSALGRSANLEQFVLDADRGQLTATLAGRPVPLLPVDVTDAAIDRTGDELVITDDTVALSPDAAAQLASQLGLPQLPTVQLGQLRVVLQGS